MNRQPPATTFTIADVGAVAFAMVFPSVLTYAYFIALADAPAWIHKGSYGVLKTIQFGFPLAWYLFIQRRKLSLRLESSAGMVPAVAFGAVVFVTIWCLYRYVLLPAGMMAQAKLPVTEKIEEFVTTPIAYFGLALFYGLMHSGLEEYYWRWFVFGQLRRMIAVPAAIIISSIGFTAHHVILLTTFFGWTSSLTWLFSLAIVIGGSIWAWMYHRYGSIYAVWLSHMFVDAGIFLVGYSLWKS